LTPQFPTTLELEEIEIENHDANPEVRAR